MCKAQLVFRTVVLFPLSSISNLTISKMLKLNLLPHLIQSIDLFTQSRLMLCNHMDCSTTALPYPSLFPRLLTFTSSGWMMPSNGLILYHGPSPPALCLSSIGVFSNESAVCLGWWKYWSFSPSNEYSGLIFFRMDWFDLLAVQGTLKSFLQHHSLKASIHRHSTFFMVQLSYPYTNWKQTKIILLF